MKRSERKVAAGLFARIYTAFNSPFAAQRAFINTLTIAVLALALNTTVFAQSNTDGYIYGSVSGASNVTVVAVNNDTGLRRSATTDSRGNYRISTLSVGKYTVTAGDQVRDEVNVSIGSGSAVHFGSGMSDSDVIALEKFTVSGSLVSPIDVSQAESVTILREETIDLLPVPRNLAGVALLAPGTTQGDAAFGNLVSFGGASVAENAYFINGFNVTNFRNGLGGSAVPFEFYKEFQVKTGGYGAEFGRSTGGVVNTVTKRGTNTWHFDYNVFYSPDELSSDADDVFVAGGRVLINSKDYNETFQQNFAVGGPIWKDHVFIYGIYNLRDTSAKFATPASLYTDSSVDPFWGAKLDIQLTDDHSIEFTAFSDKRETIRDRWMYDSTTDTRNAFVGSSTFKRGGKNYIGSYTGHFFDDRLTLRAMYGEGTYDRTDEGAGDVHPYIVENRNPPTRVIGFSTSATPGAQVDTRKAKRIDGEFTIWNNRIRFGYDKEKNTSNDLIAYSGGVYYRYYNVPGSGIVNGAAVPGGTTEYVRERHYANGGGFVVDTTAVYVEDTVKLLDDRLVLTVGLRNETFDNQNASGASFIKVEDQLAPRIAGAFDMKGDGKSKIFGSYGKYYLPIASNTNIRLAGAELFTEDYYVLNSVDANFLPSKGAKIGGQVVFSDGKAKDTRSIVNSTIEPMYQDELILGYQTAIGNNWSAGIRGVYRNVGSTIEDVAIDAALNKYAVSKGYDTLYGFDAHGFDYYVLTNPGKPISLFIDFGSGTAEPVTLAAADLGYPESVRKYVAVELFAERLWDGKWYASFNYTWSHSYGNNEGSVRSDNGQDDAGLTTLFDQPGLADGSYGDLPNDKRHKIKMFGAYKLTDEFQIGANLQVSSGRPINAFGVHPTDLFAQAYGAESFFQNGVLVPRGSKGTTDWVTKLDLSLKYKPKFSWAKERITLGVDVFNVLDLRGVTEVDELAEEGNGAARAEYLSPTAFQTPRYVRFSAEFSW